LDRASLYYVLVLTYVLSGILSVCRACHIEICMCVTQILRWGSATSAKGNFTSLSESEFNIPWSYADIKWDFFIYTGHHLNWIRWQFKLDDKTAGNLVNNLYPLRSFSRLIVGLSLFLSFYSACNNKVPISIFSTFSLNKVISVLYHYPGGSKRGRCRTLWESM